MCFASVGESPCSGCETGLPSRPFAFRSATAFTPRFAPLRGHGITTARALRRAAASRHDPYANGLTASRMRSACCLRGSGTSAPAPLRQHARAYAYRGLRALASLSMARSDRPNMVLQPTPWERRPAAMVGLPEQQRGRADRAAVRQLRTVMADRPACIHPAVLNLWRNLEVPRSHWGPLSGASRRCCRSTCSPCQWLRQTFGSRIREQNGDMLLVPGVLDGWGPGCRGGMDAPLRTWVCGC